MLCDVAVNLIFGDSFEKLKEITDNSIDSCPTDPPYGIRFMGKAWDGKDIHKRAGDRRAFSTDPDPKSGDTGGHRSIAAEAGKYNRSANANAIFQEWTESWAREIYRVLKPGAYIACFASTRTYHRMACGIEDAGFEIRDQLAWTFGQGFPKSKNLGAGRGTALKPAWEPICLARKPIATGNLEQNLALYGTGGLNIDACKIPFISDADEAEAKEKNRHAEFDSGPTDNQILGKFSKARENYEAKGRWPANLMHDGSDEVMEEFEKFGETQSRPHDGHGERLDTQNTGWGFKNMPGGFSDAGSVARFFFESPFSQIESLFCRAEALFGAWNPYLANTVNDHSYLSENHVASALRNVACLVSRGDRLLSDLKIHSTSVTPEELKRLCVALIMVILNSEKGASQDLLHEKLFPNGCRVKCVGIPGQIDTIATTISLSKSGGFADATTFVITPLNSELGEAACVSRFNYCAKTSTSERDAGLEDFATDQQDESRVAGRLGSDNPRNRGAKQRANHHPTVKPIALMRWLCRLITPAGGTAIDPFLGSGSTGVACVHEGLGFVGIEREEPYFKIAQARIAEAQGPLFANLPTE